MSQATAPLDRRLHAIRPDLADARLKGQVDAPNFAEAQPASVGVQPLALLRRPMPDAPMESQLLPGEDVSVYERAKGWAWVQCAHDGYVGYVRASGLVDAHVAPASHTVAVRETVLLSDAEQVCEPIASWCFATPVRLAAAGKRFHRVEPDGYVFASHLQPADKRETDWVMVAERLLGLPYLWGGRGAGGIDCSGLVQVALGACGIACLRDTDQQAISIGQAVPLDPSAWQRGDIIYVRGHVVLDRGDGQVVHATGYAWSVIVEPRDQCLQRLAGMGLPVTNVRRPVLP